MAIQLTNSLSRKKETFTPLVPGEVKMYVCGPTVYNFIHVGNARPLVFFDVVRRYLELSGYKVTHVMNYTDVDDKIINRAREEKTDWKNVIQKYIGEYERDMQLLGVNKPTRMPRVTETIPQIIRLIEGLVKNGAAYVVDGEVFFSVRKFKDYGKLSGKNIDDLLAGARVEVGEKKQDPLDFSLWKPQKTPDEAAWQSPWGLGRPGWHIECSAMALEFLGETFDIHGGGVDLTHPHHENEIAQSEAFTHKPFVKVWLHNNMLNVNQEKMSKSLGNFFLCREFIEKFGPEVLKYLLLSGHYRSMIDFSDQNIKDVQSALHRYYTTLGKCQTLAAAEPTGTNPNPGEAQALEFGKTFEANWKAAMDDDFNTAKVLGMVFEYVRLINTCVDKKGFKLSAGSQQMAQQFCDQMKKLASVVNILGLDSKTFLTDLKERVLQQRNINKQDLEKMVADRITARKNKDFKTADDIRQKCTALGIELRDAPDSTEWDVTFNA